jgi:hypothetical protein
MNKINPVNHVNLVILSKYVITNYGPFINTRATN